MAEGSYVTAGESYERDMDYLPDRITRAARAVAVQPGRYRLVAARACPWANRAIIVRRLLGLEDALPMGLAAPVHDADSWTFDLDPGGVDPVLGIHRLREAYLARDPGYQHGVTVPAMVDIPSRGRWSPTTSRRSPTTSSSSGASTIGPARRTCGRRSAARRWRR